MSDRRYSYEAPCPLVHCRCGLVHPLTEPGREPVWVPWPTETGFWWARERPGAAACVVEARVEAESSCIYFSGVECPLYANEPREAWEFCRAEPPR